MTSMARTGMFSQGKAQPVQQSFGTPYREATMGNPPGTKSFGASPPSPASGSPQKQSQPFSAWAPQQQPAGQPARQPSSQTFTGDPRGLWALTPENRPPPAQVGPAQTPWGPSMDPGKDQLALIAAMNEQRMQRQLAFNSAGTTPRPQGGFPKLDFNKAMQDAGLGQGSPSMSPEYGDSMIKRLNEQFSKPFQGAPAMPQTGSLMLPQEWSRPQTQTMLPQSRPPQRDGYAQPQPRPMPWDWGDQMPPPRPTVPPPLAADRTKEDTRRRVQNPERFRRFDPVTNKEVPAAQPVESVRPPIAPWWSNGIGYPGGIF